MANLVITGLTSAAAAIPDEKKQAAFAWIKKATGGAVSTISSAMSYANKGPANAAVIAEGLVRAGAPVDMVVTALPGDINANVRASLLRLGQGLIAAEDSARPGLNATVPDTANDLMRLNLGKSLVRAFGSLDNAQKVQLGLQTLRQSDFDWLRAMPNSVLR